MTSARIVESIIAEVRAAKKIDRIRNIWGDVQRLREARLTYKQIAAQLPKYGIEDITLNEFHCICYRIRKGAPVADIGAAIKAPHIVNKPDFDPLADAKRRRDEKTQPIFQQRKEK
jgi:hypothetical protein